MLRGGKMNFMDQSLYDLKVGLVLAGGGTKGGLSSRCDASFMGLRFN